ncbi:hypothetical protein ACPA9J_27065 [Pseudomonas aeruginosa]
MNQAAVPGRPRSSSNAFNVEPPRRPRRSVYRPDITPPSDRPAMQPDDTAAAAASASCFRGRPGPPFHLARRIGARDQPLIAIAAPAGATSGATPYGRRPQPGARPASPA